MNTFECARSFVYRNARPLDLARWQNRFEDGERSAVLNALAAYHNPDGGFGHGIEADYLNPDSTPMGVWAATEILHEIGIQDAYHPIVDGILRYLESGADFDAAHGQWLNTVPSNNDHPHAIWWHFGGESQFEYNPTAALAGFAVRFAAPESPLYIRSCEIVHAAFAWFEAHVPFEEMHVTKCFIRLYEYLDDADSDLVDLDHFEDLLRIQIKANICPDPDRWFTEYVSRPSAFIGSRLSPWYRLCPELVERESELLCAQQLPDGSWPVTWHWGTNYPAEESISINWWRSAIILENMAFLSAFGKV